MNSHSWTIASVPAKMAAPIERAGFTDVPVRGMVAKWIIDSERPIASGARAGCSLRSSVTARIAITKTKVVTASTRRADHHGEPAAVVAEAVLPEVALGAEPVEAVPDDPQHSAGENCADELTAHVEAESAPRPADRSRAAPRVTAGLKWPPEIRPTAYAITSTVSPKARPVVITSPPVARAVPTPKKTRTKVPRTSAAMTLGARRSDGGRSGAVSAMPRCSLCSDRWIPGRSAAYAARSPVAASAGLPASAPRR